MKQTVVAFFVGLIFAVGLGISGMTQPGKVVGFLDIFGQWDPSLLFVMGGAVAVYGVGFQLITRRGSSFFGGAFQIPNRKDIDGKLLVGSTLFGMGWGLAGYCPGPALVSTATLGRGPLIFITAMFLGMVAHRVWDSRFCKP